MAVTPNSAGGFCRQCDHRLTDNCDSQWRVAPAFQNSALQPLDGPGAGLGRPALQRSLDKLLTRKEYWWVRCRDSRGCILALVFHAVT